MSVPRRSFFKAGAALAVTATVPARSTRAAVTAAHSSIDPWVEIHADNLRHNVRQVSGHVGGTPILAVIKNNGYGLGTVNVAHLLAPMPEIAGLAVIKLQEAMALRDAGIRKPILLIGAVTDGELDATVARDIEPMIYTPLGETLDRIAARRQKPVPLHVCIDTGLGRVGVPYLEAAPLVRDLARRGSAHIRGTMMTFTEDAEFDREQLRRFRTVCDSLELEGVRLGARHAASSAALFMHRDSTLDMVRPGMALFGVYPEEAFRREKVMDLRPALALRARVIYVKQLHPGDSVGYNRPYRAAKDVWVATLPLGHADGWPRLAVKGAKVRIGDRLYPVIGTVSASHCVVELGDEPRVKAHDVATFFDWQEGSRPEDVAAATGVSVYDLVMHVNPLLPRRMA